MKVETMLMKRSQLISVVTLVAIFLTIFLNFLAYYTQDLYTVSPLLGFLTPFKGDKNGFNFALSVTILTYQFLIVIFIVLLSNGIAGEYEIGTLARRLLDPITRKQLFMGKYLTYILYCSSLFLFTFFLSFISGGILFGFHDLKEKSYLIHSKEMFFFNSLIAVTLTNFPLWALLSVVFLFSSLAKNPTLAIIISFLFFFLSYVATELGFFKPFWLTTYLFVPLVATKEMAQGLPLLLYNKIVPTVGISLGYIVIALKIGISYFNNLDL